MVSLTFLGATETVTGSKYLIEHEGKRILIDCGLFQGQKELRLRNWERLPIPPHKIDVVILTHAHLDHTGYLPLLNKEGFKGKIYATYATKDLCNILLPDSGFLQEDDARRANQYGYSKHHPALPLYTEKDARECLKHIEGIDYHRDIKLGHELSFHFSRVGHILGASFVTLKTPNGTIIFSGDVGRPNDMLLNPPEPFPGSDYLVIESTYGNRVHDKEPPTAKLAEVINQTAAKGGSIIIPAFAVGRAQLLLYLCYLLRQQGKINSHIPIFLDSPMAIDATHLLQTYQKEHKLSYQECEAVCKMATYVHSKEESKALHHLTIPAVIISASGMATGGRVLHHISHFAPDPKNTILLTGFQAAGTRGDRLKKGEKEIKIHGQLVPIRARIEELDNVSAHADCNEIILWLRNAKIAPKRVFVTHGEAEAARVFSQKIEHELGWKSEVPIYQETFHLQ